jgi:hypothetical protein
LFLSENEYVIEPDPVANYLRSEFIAWYKNISKTHPGKEVRESLATGPLNAIRASLTAGKDGYEELVLLYELRFDLPDEPKKQKVIELIENLHIEP